jgi:hypothetical protein
MKSEMMTDERCTDGDQSILDIHSKKVQLISTLPLLSGKSDHAMIIHPNPVAANVQFPGRKRRENSAKRKEYNERMHPRTVISAQIK